MRIDDPSTRYQLAYRNHLYEWPGACPNCGNRRDGLMPLHLGSGSRGAALFECGSCHTVLAPTREAIEQILATRADARSDADVRTVALVDTDRRHAVMAYRTDNRWGFMCTCGAGRSESVSRDPFDAAAAIAWGRSHMGEATL